MKLQNVEKSFAEQQHVDLSSKPFFGGLVDYIISERQHASQPQKSIGLQSSTGNNGSCTPAPSSHNATPASSQSSGFFGMAPQPNLPLEALFSTSSRSSGPSPTAASEWHPPGAPPGHRSTVPALGNWGGGEREQDEWKRSDVTVFVSMEMIGCSVSMKIQRDELLLRASVFPSYAVKSKEVQASFFIQRKYLSFGNTLVFKIQFFGASKHLNVYKAEVKLNIVVFSQYCKNTELSNGARVFGTVHNKGVFALTSDW